MQSAAGGVREAGRFLDDAEWSAVKAFIVPNLLLSAWIAGLPCAGRHLASLGTPWLHAAVGCLPVSPPALSPPLPSQTWVLPMAAELTVVHVVVLMLGNIKIS